MSYSHCPVCDGPLEQIPETRFLGCPMCRKAFVLAEVGPMSPKEERAYKRVFDSKGGRMTHPRLLDAPARTFGTDAWRPGSNGTEVPFVSRSGARLQYMYQPSTGTHAYMNLDTDLILSDEEARTLMAMG